jgi:HAD superfamily hydrolase (TIGR01490 family)
MNIHVFDIDHTLIKQSTALFFIREALKRKIIKFRQVASFPFKWLRYKYSRMEIDYVENEIRSLAGFSESVFRQIARDAFVHHGRAKLYQDGVALIKALQLQGHRILFATSSFDIFIEPICEYLDVKDLIATRLEFVDGKLTGRTDGRPAFGDEKKKAVEAWLAEHKLKMGNVCFYSDSCHDLPLLRACGKAVAVNPDPRLRKVALAKDWQILNFRRTIGRHR